MRNIGASVSPPISAAAVFRFRRSIVKPAIKKTFEKINELKRLRDDAGVIDSKPPSAAQATQAVMEQRRETQRDAIVSPFISRLHAKYDRYDKLLSKATAVDDPDLKAIAALDACETRSMDLHAKLVGAIAPEASQQVTNNIVLMLPRPVDDAPARPMIDDSNVIDIEPVD